MVMKQSGDIALANARKIGWSCGVKDAGIVAIVWSLSTGISTTAVADDDAEDGVICKEKSEANGPMPIHAAAFEMMREGALKGEGSRNRAAIMERVEKLSHMYLGGLQELRHDLTSRKLAYDEKWEEVVETEKSTREEMVEALETRILRAYPSFSPYRNGQGPRWFSSVLSFAPFSVSGQPSQFPRHFFCGGYYVIPPKIADWVPIAEFVAGVYGIVDFLCPGYWVQDDADNDIHFLSIRTCGSL